MRVSTAAGGLGVLLCGVLVLSVSPIDAIGGPVDTAAMADRTAERGEPPIDPVAAVGREVRLECSWSVERVLEGPATGVTRTEGGESLAIYTGYSELADDGRNATLMAIENGSQAWCNDELAKSDGRTAGIGVVWDLEDRLLVAFVAEADVTGDLADAAQAGWLQNHTDMQPNGDPATSLILATVDPSTGDPLDATFISARSPRSAQPADLVVDELVFEGGGYRVETRSNEPPRRRDGSSFSCPAAASYAGVYVFPADFSRPVIAAAPGCE